MLVYRVSFSLSFLIIVLYFLITNPTAELIIPKGITTTEAKAEMEIHPVEVTISSQYNSKLYKRFYAFTI